jgi:hypothetical protein
MFFALRIMFWPFRFFCMVNQSVDKGHYARGDRENFVLFGKGLIGCGH